MLKRIARTSYRRRWRVLAAWVVLLVGLIVASNAAGGVFRNEFSLNGSESSGRVRPARGEGVLGPSRVLRADRLPGRPGRRRSAGAGGDGGPVRRRSRTRSAASRSSARTRRRARSPTTARSPTPRSTSPTVPMPSSSTRPTRSRPRRRTSRSTASRSSSAGSMFADFEMPASEAIGILLRDRHPAVRLRFGARRWAADHDGAVRHRHRHRAGALTANGLDMPDFTSQAVAMIGIGVGIDYALLIVTRYRQALRDGHAPRARVVLAVDTAGRAVVFAGTTVVIAVLGMLLIDVPAVRGLAIGISLGVLMTMLAVGHAAARGARASSAATSTEFGLRHRKTAEGEGGKDSFWYRWSRVIQHRPWPAAIAGTLVLLILAAPVLSMRLGVRRRREPASRHHPPRLRPPGRGLRGRLQRPVAPRRRDAWWPGRPRRAGEPPGRAREHAGRRVRHAATAQR